MLLSDFLQHITSGKNNLYCSATPDTLFSCIRSHISLTENDRVQGVSIKMKGAECSELLGWLPVPTPDCIALLLAYALLLLLR